MTKAEMEKRIEELAAEVRELRGQLLQLSLNRGIAVIPVPIPTPAPVAPPLSPFFSPTNICCSAMRAEC